MIYLSFVNKIWRAKYTIENKEPHDCTIHVEIIGFFVLEFVVGVNILLTVFKQSSNELFLECKCQAVRGVCGWMDRNVVKFGENIEQINGRIFTLFKLFDSNVTKY